jgi:predicted Zn-dependent protease
MSGYLLQALLGHNQTALSLLEKEDQKDFNVCIAKAQILIKLGKPQDALTVLDNTTQETNY